MQSDDSLATTEGDVDTDAIADALREIASYLGLEGDRYRAEAYERGARAVEAVADLPRLLAEDRLTELPGIGPSLAGTIRELAERGTTGTLDRLRETWPPVVRELALLPRVGADRARRIHEQLAPQSLDDLAAMCEAGRVRELPGFGKASEAKVLAAIRGRHDRGALMVLDEARELGAALAAHLARDPAVELLEVCGPQRRWVEAVDRVAIAVATRAPDVVRERLRRHPLISAFTAPSAELAVARVGRGAIFELHTTIAERFGAALVRATGSPEHVAGLEALARDRGTTLDALAGRDEPSLYAALGLPWLPPEVRDGTDEIAEAQRGVRFDDLVTAADITGAIHCHTVYSDGKNTVEEMVTAARARGLGLITITDHSPTAHYAGGVTPDRLTEQWREIEAAEKSVGIRVLRGTESDILADGRLDYPDEILGQLDVVIASIHNRYKLDEDGMTARLVAAMRQPIFKVWGHALGRLILRREPVPVRFDEVLDAIAESQAVIEINGDPRRLDLDPVRARRAHARGIGFVLSTDAHSTRQLDHLPNAVAMARRARLRPADILNTRPPEELARALRPQQARRAGAAG
jgi:DNA polymerase (family X)